jgi:hypothetical protein
MCGRKSRLRARHAFERWNAPRPPFWLLRRIPRRTGQNSARVLALRRGDSPRRLFIAPVNPVARHATCTDFDCGSIASGGGAYERLQSEVVGPHGSWAPGRVRGDPAGTVRPRPLDPPHHRRTNLGCARDSRARQAGVFDCHSNETKWPAYASIAPASWLVQRDVSNGRAVLNFSEWTRPQEEAKEAAEEVFEGEMPPAAYTLVHTHARLNAVERNRLAQGLARSLGEALKHEARERDR